MSERSEHWESVYQSKDAREVSWYRPHLDESLRLIEASGVEKTALIVDVGGGASTLVDDLLARGYTTLTVLDLSEAALSRSRERLGERAEAVRWLVGDATSPLCEEESVALWHDRAVFHFLTESDAQRAYVAQVYRSVRCGGYVVLGTFALDGPERCSGLPVKRYDAAGLVAVLGEGFELVTSSAETHQTPWESPQSFVYVLCRRI